MNGPFWGTIFATKAKRPWVLKKNHQKTTLSSNWEESKQAVSLVPGPLKQLHIWNLKTVHNICLKLYVLRPGISFSRSQMMTAVCQNQKWENSNHFASQPKYFYWHDLRYKLSI